MSWVLFSILAPLTWAICNMVDKYVLSKWVRKPIIPVMILGTIGLVASFIVFLAYGFSELTYAHILLSFVAGIFYVLSNLFYFKAVQIEEISRVVPLFYISPIFVLILASVFLGEAFTPVKYLAIFLLVIGAVLISSKRTIRFDFRTAFWFMIFASVALSINMVIVKYLLDFADFWTIFSYVRIGAFIGVIPAFYLNFSDIVSLAKEHGKKAVGVISVNESLNVVAVLFITIASSQGYVTLVEALSSVHPFFVLIFSLFLSIFYPKILKEEISRSTVLLKLIAIILIFLGAVLII